MTVAERLELPWLHPGPGGRHRCRVADPVPRAAAYGRVGPGRLRGGHPGRDRLVLGLTALEPNGYRAPMTSTSERGTDLAEEPMGAVVHRLSEQIPELVRSEMRLAQAELAEKGKRAGVGVGLFSAAGRAGPLRPRRAPHHRRRAPRPRAPPVGRGARSSRWSCSRQRAWRRSAARSRSPRPRRRRRRRRSPASRRTSRRSREVRRHEHRQRQRPRRHRGRHQPPARRARRHRRRAAVPARRQGAGQGEGSGAAAAAWAPSRPPRSRWWDCVIWRRSAR